jgi:hypothetical protein
VLIEHPYRPDFRLTSKDQPAERARDVYGFELKLPAGKSASETVTKERDLVSQAQLSNADDNSIRVLIRSSATRSRGCRTTSSPARRTTTPSSPTSTSSEAPPQPGGPEGRPQDSGAVLRPGGKPVD